MEGNDYQESEKGKLASNSQSSGLIAFMMHFGCSENKYIHTYIHDDCHGDKRRRSPKTSENKAEGKLNS